jgi:hypothetical protein
VLDLGSGIIQPEFDLGALITNPNSVDFLNDHMFSLMDACPDLRELYLEHLRINRSKVLSIYNFIEVLHLALEDGKYPNLRRLSLPRMALTEQSSEILFQLIKGRHSLERLTVTAEPDGSRTPRDSYHKLLMRVAAECPSRLSLLYKGSKGHADADMIQVTDFTTEPLLKQAFCRGSVGPQPVDCSLSKSFFCSPLFDSNLVETVMSFVDFFPRVKPELYCTKNLNKKRKYLQPM